MQRWARVTVIGFIVLLAGVFALLNSGEMVTLYLGVTTLYRISLVWLIFTAFLCGMVTMMLVSLGHDLRLRRVLREQGMLEADPGAEPNSFDAGRWEKEAERERYPAYAPRPNTSSADALSDPEPRGEDAEIPRPPRRPIDPDR